MRKFTQKQLLNEGFWGEFLSPKIKRGIQTAKEISKVVAPKTYENISNIVSGTRDAQKRIGEAGKSMEERVLLWLDEYGYTPVPNKHGKVRLVKKFPGGDRHYSLKVAEKSTDPDTGETIPGRKFRYPTAIILYDKGKNMFRKVILPARDQWVNGVDGIEYWDERSKEFDRNQHS